MPDDILINGKPTNQIPVTDRGLHYGDGLFETIVVKAGKLLCWDTHLARLLAACQQLNLHFDNVQLLTDEATNMAQDMESGVIKVILTRGSGGRGYAPPVESTITRIVCRYPASHFPVHIVDAGIAVRICATRYGHQPALAGMKHLNRLEQVMARAEWTDEHIAEGIVLDIDDNVIEGTMSNVFLVINGELITPDLTQCGINGVVRQKLLENAEVTIRQVSLQELLSAEEVFLCNSVIGLWPVTRINDTVLKPGKLSMNLKQMLIEQEYISH